MERFNQQTAADLAGNYARNRFAREIFESSPSIETMKCDGCGKPFDLENIHATDVGTDRPAFFCTLCQAEALREPVCECRFSGDQADASQCEIHGSMQSTLVASGVTREEGEAFLTWIDRKPVKVERMQGELFPSEVA
jgi:hypothetical protein